MVGWEGWLVWMGWMVVRGWVTYEEEGEGVERQAHGVEAHPVEPALGILERLDDVFPCETFVVGGVTVRGETVVDELSLLVGEELGSVRVVVDEPIRCDGYDNGCETFLYQGEGYEYK